jgi:hypothetical protein
LDFDIFRLWKADSYPILATVNFNEPQLGLLGEKEPQEELGKMLKRKLGKTTIALLYASSIALIMFALLANLVFASGGTITMVNHYPNDGGTYEYVDHFLEQTTAVNTNTTVTVSVDGGPPIPMTYQGIKNETVPDDTVARDWYTWQTTIPAVTAPGVHTFQFFRHYYVWQDADQYWAEFDAYSDVQSFIIASSPSTPLQLPPTTRNPVYVFAAVAVFQAVAVTVLAAFAARNSNRRKS